MVLLISSILEGSTLPIVGGCELSPNAVRDGSSPACSAPSVVIGTGPTIVPTALAVTSTPVICQIKHVAQELLSTL